MKCDHSLSCNQLGDTAARALAVVMRTCRTFKRLLCVVGSTPRCVLCSPGACMHRLTSNLVSDVGVRAMAESLRNNDCVQVLGWVRAEKLRDVPPHADSTGTD